MIYQNHRIISLLYIYQTILKVPLLSVEFICEFIITINMLCNYKYEFILIIFNIPVGHKSNRKTLSIFIFSSTSIIYIFILYLDSSQSNHDSEYFPSFYIVLSHYLNLHYVFLILIFWWRLWFCVLEYHWSQLWYSWICVCCSVFFSWISKGPLQGCT